MSKKDKIKEKFDKMIEDFVNCKCPTFSESEIERYKKLSYKKLNKLHHSYFGDHYHWGYYNKMPKHIHKDNDGTCCFPYTDGENNSRIRVPSLKRNKKVWKRFYAQYPKIKERMLNGEESISGNSSIGGVLLPKSFIKLKKMK